MALSVSLSVGCQYQYNLAVISQLHPILNVWTIIAERQIIIHSEIFSTWALCQGLSATLLLLRMGG